MKIFENYQFDMTNLVNQLLKYHWQHECEIIPDYMPPYPTKDTRPTCVVKANEHYKLRYSKGPGTGTFWDAFGDDFHTPELALVALSKAAPPPNVGSVIPTHGKAYKPLTE